MTARKPACLICSGDKWFTVEETADHLKVAKRTVYKMVNNAELMAYTLSGKPGSSIRIRASDVEALLKPVIPPKVFADMRARQPGPLHRPLPDSAS